MKCSFCAKNTLYSTSYGSVLQCDFQNCYILDFLGKQSYFKVYDFMSFKKRIDSLDLEAMLMDLSPGACTELCMPFRCDEVFLLEIREILQLRELLAGAKFVIELNSILKERKIDFLVDIEQSTSAFLS